MEFKHLRDAVATQLARMLKVQTFKVAFPTGPNGEHLDQLYNLYQDSFPEGTNPIFRKQREYDCSCCKSFIRAVGGMVAIIDGKVETVWDVKVKGEPGYQPVVDACSAYVKSLPIANVFTHFQRQVGQEKSVDSLLDAEGNKKPHVWNHFSAMLPEALAWTNEKVGPYLSDKQATHDVFLRGMNEITLESIDTVLELIASKSIYKGDENKKPLELYRKEKLTYAAVPVGQAQDIFAWTRSLELSPSIARLRNTSLGTLLQDLSEGKDVEGAVKAYESMVAPTNYKRPTALVTPAMIAAAKQTVADLGLASALQRRYATLSDITVNNLLFVDRSAKPKLSGETDVFDALSAGISSKVKTIDRVEEVTIDHFIAEILPKVSSLEVLLENRHTANFVSLIAPEDPTAGDLFKWPNKFSWSYSGELADSDMRQAVQARGGSVTGVFRFTHQWNYDKRNASLMDLHVFLPANKNTVENVRCHETYGNDERVGWNHRQHAASLGTQDVDYTNPAPEGYVPVENITFPILNRMPEGRYICKIHNWRHRPPTQGGFKAEIEFEGNVYEYEYDKPLKNHEWVTVAEVTLKAGKFSIKHHLPVGQATKTTWGLPSQTFHKVNVMMLSPNYWDDKQQGNKHYFFFLDGAVNDSTARGFYNEFLREDLDKHRKVFEMVGSKMKVDLNPLQLSGLGFSSTQRNSVTVKVKGQLTRTLKVNF